MADKTAPNHMDKSAFFAKDSTGKRYNNPKDYPHTSRYVPLAKDQKQTFSYLKIESDYKANKAALEERHRQQRANYIHRPGAKDKDAVQYRKLENEHHKKEEALRTKAKNEAKAIYQKQGLNKTFNGKGKNQKQKGLEKD